MCRTGISAIALLIFVWPASADDQAKPKTPPEPAKTPVQQLAEIEKEFDREFERVLGEFRNTQDPDEKARIRDKAFKLAPDYAKKVMDLVEANPKDAVAVKGLIWVATISRRLPPPPQAKDALDRLIRDHLESPAIAEAVPLFEGRPDGAAILRKLREKNPDKGVKALAGLSLANLLAENSKPSPTDSAEIESLLAAVLKEAKAIKDFPEAKLREAEGNLFEVRYLSIGKAAPDIESADLNGKKVKLSDYKGKVVVLDFWATWCGPCRAMIPHEREMVKKHEGKPFVLVSVSADDEKETLTKFIEKEPMPWTHWFNGPQGGVLEKWNVKFFPTIYVIDAKGTIRFKNIRNEELSEAVETLLKEVEEKK